MDTSRRTLITRIQQDASLGQAGKARALFLVMNGRSLTDALEAGREADLTASQTKAAVEDTHEADSILPEGTVLSPLPSPPPCPHYERNCFIVARCCGKVYRCRLCHDAAEAHKIDRFATRKVVCKECGLVQPVSNACANSTPSLSDGASGAGICSTVQFATYYCPVCKLWMGVDKTPFHCEGCGICRVGGRGNFKHCDKCCMCVGNEAWATHGCRDDKYKVGCPVCFEDLFTSRETPTEMRCGHAIHSRCFRVLCSKDYRCPLCKKSVDDMAPQWQALAEEIANTPLPDDLKRRCEILCHDCDKKSLVQWHFIACQCTFCHGFNTAITGAAGEEEEEEDGDVGAAAAGQQSAGAPEGLPPVDTSHPAVGDGADGASAGPFSSLGGLVPAMMQSLAQFLMPHSSRMGMALDAHAQQGPTNRGLGGRGGAGIEVDEEGEEGEEEEEGEGDEDQWSSVDEGNEEEGEQDSLQ